MFLKLLIITLIIVAIAFLGFALRVLLKKKGQFPEIHIGHNKEMRKRKIYCAKVMDKIEYNNKHTICTSNEYPECKNCERP